MNIPAETMQQVVGDAEARLAAVVAKLHAAEAAIAHRDARLAAIVQEMRKEAASYRNSDAADNQAVDRAAGLISRWADQLAALLPPEDGTT